MNMRRTLNIFLLSVLYAVAGFAQVTSSSISGFVLDPAGKPIAKAKVTVSDPSHAISRSVFADSSGFYRVVDLPPALYQVSGEAAQFSKTEGPSVQLEVNE